MGKHTNKIPAELVIRGTRRHTNRLEKQTNSKSKIKTHARNLSGGTVRRIDCTLTTKLRVLLLMASRNAEVGGPRWYLDGSHGASIWSMIFFLLLFLLSGTSVSCTLLGCKLVSFGCRSGSEDAFLQLC